MMSLESKGREATAKRLALESELTVEQALGVLATIPKESASASSIREHQKGTIITGPWVA